MMKKIGAFLFLFIILSCSDDAGNIPITPASYTILIYMAADNSMDKDVAYTLKKIKEGVAGSAGNVVVYLDAKQSKPRLFKIERSGNETLLKSYDEEDSASSLTLKQVISDTKQVFPSGKFGLVLWSHSLGWVPAIYSFESHSISNNSPQTRFTAIDENPEEGTSAITFLEIDAIANDLPDNVAEFIWFDVCLMGNVESLYQLRKKAKYLVASPTEVLLASEYDASGIPYHKVLPYLFGQKEELKTACAIYMKHYSTKKYKILRSATISLVDAHELDGLFLSTQKILKSKLAGIEPMKTNDLQKYYTNDIPPYYFDLEDFVEQTASTAEYMNFKSQLAKTVLYKATTPTFMVAEDNFIAIDSEHFSGLSTYIPLSAYKNTTDYHYYFDKLSWSDVY